jgi:hypothetical protein
LSSLGEASVSTMKHVEEPPKDSRRLGMRCNRPILRNLLTILLVCALIASLVFNVILLLKYTGSGNQNNNTSQAPLFWQDWCVTHITAMYGMSFQQEKLPPVFEMGDNVTLLAHYFGIRLNSSTKIVFQFRATAPVNFQLALDVRDINWEVDTRPELAEAVSLGQVLINETQTTSLNSEFYVQNPGIYVFVFEPVECSPASTVTFNAHLN